MRRCIPLIVLALVAACASFDEDDGLSDGGVVPPDMEVPCNAGEVRCEGQSFQRCQAGTFVEEQQCPPDQVCTTTLGCAECDPVVGTGCKDNVVHACSGQGTLGAAQQDCLGLSCQGGQCLPPKCTLEAKLVYVVDWDYNLLSFDPTREQDPFRLIAELKCPAGEPWPDAPTPATPFSMSVDRGGRAWVLYTSGEIFWVDTTTGKCTLSPFVKGQKDYYLFGMGFVADQAGSDAERLYVLTERNYSPIGDNNLGYIQPSNLDLTHIAKLTGNIQVEYTAELSGTGAAELYAYFPGVDQSNVGRVNKQTGLVEKTWPVPTVQGDVRAWAFAHWGGKFYIFVTAEDGGLFKPRVLRLDPDTGKADTFLESIPYRIVGAGVSTCAPLID